MVYNYTLFKSSFFKKSLFNIGNKYDTSDEALFREIPAEPEVRYRRKPYQESNPFVSKV